MIKRHRHKYETLRQSIREGKIVGDVCRCTICGVVRTSAIPLPSSDLGHLRSALTLAREYISQDHGGFKKGDGYWEQTGEILGAIDRALALSSQERSGEQK